MRSLATIRFAGCLGLQGTSRQAFVCAAVGSMRLDTGAGAALGFSNPGVETPRM